MSHAKASGFHTSLLEWLMSHLPQLFPRACRRWAGSQASGTWEAMLFVIISAQRAVLLPGDTGACLGTSVLVTLRCFWHRMGWGRGCCPSPHSVQDGPTEKGLAAVSVVLRGRP